MIRLMAKPGPLFLVLLCLGGCISATKRPAVPSDVRNGWFEEADGNPYRPIDPQMILALRKSLRQSTDAIAVDHTATRPPLNVLAVSGGGSYGAFDVGVLCGWSD